MRVAASDIWILGNQTAPHRVLNKENQAFVTVSRSWSVQDMGKQVPSANCRLLNLGVSWELNPLSAFVSNQNKCNLCLISHQRVTPLTGKKKKKLH